MKRVLYDPVVLNGPALDAVAGGFSFNLISFLSVATSVNNKSAINSNFGSAGRTEMVQGTGNGAGSFTNANGTGNGR